MSFLTQVALISFYERSKKKKNNNYISLKESCMYLFIVSGMHVTGIRCYRLTAVCLGLLCVLLLAAIAVLWVKFTTERDQLQSSYTNLTIERDQLQTSYTNLTIERDQIEKDRDGLQKKLAIPEAQTIKQGWRYFSSHIYYISADKKSWSESRQDCRQRGADLLIINSREEQVINTRLPDAHWQAPLPGIWKWVDDSALTTEFWWKGEPNNHQNNDCAITGYRSAGSGSLSTWADYSCNIAAFWICEKNLTNFEFGLYMSRNSKSLISIFIENSMQ
uniref:C-type lectin domain-containing protein n=1 Tax=Pygocentrus nattereri TaxID=42514 RepID=A0A3B4EPF7_PYGNA